MNPSQDELDKAFAAAKSWPKSRVSSVKRENGLVLFCGENGETLWFMNESEYDKLRKGLGL